MPPNAGWIYGGSFCVKAREYYAADQASDNHLLARWDNAPHHPEIKTHPHHLHTEKGVKESPAMDVESVLTAVVDFLD